MSAAVPEGAATEPVEAARIVVVFGGGCDLWWLRLLKPGFRHCSALVGDGAHWVLCDPLANRTELRAYDAAGVDPDPASWFRAQGHAVIETTAGPFAAGPGWPELLTCVGAVKRLVGLDAPWVLTPWQLYRALQKREDQRRRSPASARV